MCAENIAVGINQIAGLWRYALSHELAVVAIGNEADFLAVRLVGDRQAGVRRDMRRISLLGYSPTGSSKSLEFGLAQGEEDIRLVLAGIHALQQPGALCVSSDSGVVSCGDVVGVHEEGAAKQEVELYLVVAGEAGVRRAAHGRTRARSNQ